MVDLICGFGNRTGEGVGRLKVVTAEAVFCIALSTKFYSFRLLSFTKNFVVDYSITSNYFFKVLGSAIRYYTRVLKNVFKFWL